MRRSTRYRAFLAIAMQRLAESDLRSLHDEIASMHPYAFIDLVRGLEDEVDAMLPSLIEQFGEIRSLPGLNRGFVEEIEQIRRRELKLSVSEFAHLLTKSLQDSGRDQKDTIPNFEPRRGLQDWLRRLVASFSEQEVYHAVVRLRDHGIRKTEPDWKLR